MTPQPSGIPILLEAWGMFSKLNDRSESRARPWGKAELLQNLVNWLLMGAEWRRGQWRASAAGLSPQHRPCGFTYSAIKADPRSQQELPHRIPVLSPKRHCNLASHVHYVAFMSFLPLFSITPVCGGEECGALLRGSAFLSFHLSCLPPPCSRWGQVMDGIVLRHKFWGEEREVERIKGRCPDIRG